jgi:hypothetical protein
MSRCLQCFGLNGDASYSHLCHACLVALEPTPQGANGVTGKADAAPAVVGLEPVAFMTHHDEPMLFPTWDEAVQYCDDDESPISLFHAADVAKLQMERVSQEERIATMTEERDNWQRQSSDNWNSAVKNGLMLAAEQVYSAQLREALETCKNEMQGDKWDALYIDGVLAGK